ncbi:MAG: aminopeptidase P family protein [Acidimicrobiia bacterium]|nr:aminopeptidase P family protein [Acidimicrobiia bacterium]
MGPQRLDAVRAALAEAAVEVALFSVGAEMPWLVGYEAMPLERLTMLVVPVDAPATLVVPALEEARVGAVPDEVTVRPWGETDDPVAMVADLVGSARRAVIGDRTWARFVLALQAAVDGLALSSATPVVGPLRAVKDADELAALRSAAAAADRVQRALVGGEVPLEGRTERDVADELGRRLLAEGHTQVNFTIVAAGSRAASPHHEPGDDRIARGDVVLADIGGTYPGPHGVGYCSDITRCVAVGGVAPEVREAYEVLAAAQAAGVAAARVGVAAADVDRAARSVISDAGMGARFIHRTGHGIGVEAHEDPYLVEGNRTPLQAGNVFSVEPGIYVPGRFGLRLEDIVAATPDGPERLNRLDRSLAAVDA